jgi:hypothetical protein
MEPNITVAAAVEELNLIAFRLIKSFGVDAPGVGEIIAAVDALEAAADADPA